MLGTFKNVPRQKYLTNYPHFSIDELSKTAEINNSIKM